MSFSMLVWGSLVLCAQGVPPATEERVIAGSAEDEFDEVKIENLLKGALQGTLRSRCDALILMGRLRREAAKRNPKRAEKLEKALLQALNDEEEQIVNHAVGALTGWEPQAKSAIPVLTALIASKKKGDLRLGAAAIGLRRFGRESAMAIPVLLDRLNAAEESTNAKTMWISTLADIGHDDPKVIAAIRKLLLDEKQEGMIRYVSARVLGQASIEKQTLRKDIRHILSTTKSDKSTAGKPGYYSLRAGVLEALARLGVEQQDVRTLIGIVDDPKEEDAVYEKAIDALSSLGPGAKIATDALMFCATDLNKNTHIRLKALGALGNIGPAAKATLGALKELEKQTLNPYHREVINRAIIKISAAE